MEEKSVDLGKIKDAELIRTREFGKTWSWVIYGGWRNLLPFSPLLPSFKTYRSMVFQGNAHLIPWIPLFSSLSWVGRSEKKGPSR